MIWLKGNLHTHTNNSDGDSTPDKVVKLYDALGYDFLYITDHNYLTSIEGLKTNNMLLISGCEVTLESEGVPVHVNALNVKEIKIPESKLTIQETIQSAVDAVKEAGGIAQINHPNYQWAFDAKHMKQVKGWQLFEVYNSHPLCNSFGGGGVKSNEQMWDELLSMGFNVWGTACDDTHTLSCDNWEDYSSKALPARAWIVVNASEKSPEAIADSLKQGDFYASTGVTIDSIYSNDKYYELQIKQNMEYRYTTYFIGLRGEILGIDYSTKPRYNFKGNEKYVRSKVADSLGSMAWTQPVWLNNRI